KDLLKGHATLANGSIPKGDFAFDEKKAVFPYDPAKAKDILGKSGYKNEEILIETINSYQPVTEAVVSMWKAVGINAKMLVLEPVVRNEEFSKKTIRGAMWLLPGSALGDPDGLIWRLLQPGGNQNYGDVPEEFTKLGNEAHISLDSALRQKNYA